MKYLFILGRNIKLSISEILSYFESRNRVISYSQNKNGLLMELKEKVADNEINELGGVLAIGEVIAEGNMKEIEKTLNSKILYYGKDNKLSYIIWNYSESAYDEASLYLKKRFKEEKLKASQKPLRGLISMQNGKHIENVPSDSLVKEQYFIFNSKGKEYFGNIIQKYNAKEIETRDMSKPVRRQELAISPRLSKIMINLTQVKEGETLLDPFCGIGAVLQEALLKKIKVVGLDINNEAILGARKNLEFFGFKPSEFKLIHVDSRESILGKINGVASEPDFGEILTKMPSKKEAENKISSFEKLLIQVINHIKDKVNGRLVFTTPLINTPQGRIQVNVNNILKETGLKIAKIGPYQELIQEFREGQIVGRGILILEK